MAQNKKSKKSARHRAKLKAKFNKSRARQKGELRVRKAGGRMKPAGRR